MDYKITVDFFANEKPHVMVPCIRAEYQDGTFIQVSHRSPIAFPVPFFVVRMDDDEMLYAKRREIIAEEGNSDELGKWFEHDGKRYALFYNYSDTPFMSRLAHHNRAKFYHLQLGVSLKVDDVIIFVMDFTGNCKLHKDLTRHHWSCLKTFCRDFGNDLTYGRIMKYWRDKKYGFNILDDLINELEGGN